MPHIMRSGDYFTFLRDHLKYRVMPSTVGERMRGNDLMRYSLA